MTAPPESGDHQRGTGRARTFRRRPCTGWYRHGGVLTVPAGLPAARPSCGPSARSRSTSCWSASVAGHRSGTGTGWWTSGRTACSPGPADQFVILVRRAQQVAWGGPLPRCGTSAMSQLDLPPEALTGRTRELGFLQGFARETAVSGGALILSGDPGMGKTALLDALADSVLTLGDDGPAGGRPGVRGGGQLRRAQPGAVPPARRPRRARWRAPGRLARRPGFRGRAPARPAPGVHRHAGPAAGRGGPRAAAADRGRPALDRPGQCRRAELRGQEAGREQGGTPGRPQDGCADLLRAGRAAGIRAEAPGRPRCRPAGGRPVSRHRSPGEEPGAAGGAGESAGPAGAAAGADRGAALGRGAASLGAAARPAPAGAVHLTRRPAPSPDPGAPPRGGPGRHRGPSGAGRGGRSRLPAR